MGSNPIISHTKDKFTMRPLRQFTSNLWLTVYLVYSQVYIYIHQLVTWYTAPLFCKTKVSSSSWSSSMFPAISVGFIIFGEIFVYVTVFNPTIEVVTFCLCGWCVLGVFVAGIHPSRTWMSGSFETVPWNACVHRLDLGLYSHPKEFFREWSQIPC